MAYEIIKKLKTGKEDKLLQRLHVSVEAKDMERNKKHEVWEGSFDWKECKTNDFIRQNWEYIHNNPVKGKWNLAATAADYKHSSARFYLTGHKGVYPVSDFCELADMDLTKPLRSHDESTLRT